MPAEIPDDIADDLRRYLADEERVERQKRIEGKVDALGHGLTTLGHNVAMIQQSHGFLAGRVDKIEANVEKVGETSGSYHLVELQSKADDAKWWKRAIITAVIVLVTSAVSATAAHMLTRGTTPASAATK